MTGLNAKIEYHVLTLYVQKWNKQIVCHLVYNTENIYHLKHQITIAWNLEAKNSCDSQSCKIKRRR